MPASVDQQKRGTSKRVDVVAPSGSRAGALLRALRRRGRSEQFGDPRGSPARLSAGEREILRERRAEWWSWVGRVAVGVFFGSLAFAAVTGIVFDLWLDSVL